MIFMIINKNTVNIPFLSISLSRKTLNVHFPTFLLSYFSLVLFGVYKIILYFCER